MAAVIQFANKVVIVTDAGSGTGADTALLLAEGGAKVVIVGAELLVAVADVSEMHMVEKRAYGTVNKFWAFHYAVNNAGISGANYDLPNLPENVWDETIALNLSSVFYYTKEQLAAIN
ncbi:hypothetical protein PENANT_c085G00270 [Penicillium antarcticum]|uniref:Uncharacterized protein n=1 Tax=Penicillium antarcticum TaxID=416450 RepID=A0A1V6PPT7_9EURO|nr:uncharacterized protein N7508_007300 [Penicillium antarcticum]KAJ5300057.1 hypothetical protein N7508_007300 [Penicillium antarcticum]OQD78747.1 hypothetical protein PENANT_c085G00270 [Penicillium antarcticum]